MVKAVTTVEIAKPVNEVFSFLTDVANADQWVVGLVDVRHDGPIRLGATGTDVRTMGNKEIEMPWTVTAYEPPHRAVFEYSSPFYIRAEFSFAEIEGGTLVECATTMEPSGWWRLMGPLLAREGRKTDRLQFEKARKILETSSADTSTGEEVRG